METCEEKHFGRIQDAVSKILFNFVLHNELYASFCSTNVKNTFLAIYEYVVTILFVSTFRMEIEPFSDWNCVRICSPCADCCCLLHLCIMQKESEVMENWCWTHACTSHLYHISPLQCMHN